MKDYISKQTLLRIPSYLALLQQQKKIGVNYISATTIAAMLGLNHVQVRKDLSCTSTAGKPKVGYETDVLISDIQKFLGYDNVKNAVIVGVGGLGKTLLNYTGFESYGLNIVYGFDINESLIGILDNDKEIYHINDLYNKVAGSDIKIGIIATTEEVAQGVCDSLVQSGIKGIWNFSPINLNVPKDVIVQNENMAAGLALLSNRMNNIEE